ncbi:hypothetical protein BKA70DRAFT_1241005 [Coprinopsis sp. MPI-PUGE-AT-0042]|nr:hypothetical protein BKA70DRAFT_1241005 [Coprinopsis sp. MPI-PUGE-AT-0042]
MYPCLFGSACRSYPAEDLKRLKDQDQELRVRINTRVCHLQANACRSCGQHALLCVPVGLSCNNCMQKQEQCSYGDPLNSTHFQGAFVYGKPHNIPVSVQSSPPKKQPTTHGRDMRYGAPPPVDTAQYRSYTQDVVAAAQAVASVQSGTPEKVMDVMALASLMVTGQGSSCPESMNLQTSLPVGYSFGDETSNHTYPHGAFGQFPHEGSTVQPAFNAWPEAHTFLGSSGVIQSTHPFPTSGYFQC